LSGSYTPGSNDEVLLFQEQNKFMYDVFTLLQTPMEIHSVRNFEASRDAQANWRSLTLYMHTSNRADIAIENLLGQITSKRLATAYKGTTQQFMKISLLW